MKFFKPYFTIFFWSVVFFALVFWAIWHIREELLETIYLIGNFEANQSQDMKQTLDKLITESKLISAKDYFGFYISYYNNFVLILSAIIGLFGISSFFYFKDKNEKNLRDIENKTKEEIKSYLKNGEVDIKKLIQEIVKEQVESGRGEDIKNIKQEIDSIKEQIEKIDTNSKNEEIPYKIKG